MVSNTKKSLYHIRVHSDMVQTFFSHVMLLLLSNNINMQSPWMLSLEIFGSVCAAAADYQQIRYGQ